METLSLTENAGIRVRGLRTAGFEDVNIDIPFPAITLVLGGMGSGKSVLLDGVLARESLWQLLPLLDAKTGISKGRAIGLGGALVRDLDSISGLPFTVSISSLAAALPKGLVIQDYLEIRPLFKELLLTQGRPRCPCCKLGLERGEARVLLADFLGSQAHSLLAQDLKGKLLFGRVLWRKESPAGSKVSARESAQAASAIFNHWSSGGRRVVIGDKLITLPPAGSFEHASDKQDQVSDLKTSIEEMLGNLDKEKLQIVTAVERTSSVDKAKAESLLNDYAEELKKSVHAVHLLAEARDKSDSSVIASSYLCTGYYCEQCSSLVPAEEFKLLLEMPGEESNLLLGEMPLGLLYSSTARELLEMDPFSEAKRTSCASGRSPLTQSLSFKLGQLEELGLAHLSLNTLLGDLGSAEKLLLVLARWRMSFPSECLFVFDSPSAVLHRRDLQRLYQASRCLVRDRNGVLIAESQYPEGLGADFVIELESSVSGMRVGYQGPERERHAQPVVRIAEVSKDIQNSLPYSAKGISLAPYLEKSKDVGRIPYGSIVIVSGEVEKRKYTLLNDLRDAFKARNAAKIKGYAGLDYFRRIHLYPEDEVGPNSRVADYLGIGVLLREVFSQLPEARMHGFESRDLAFGAARTSCSLCSGRGFLVSQLQGVDSVEQTCGACLGLGFDSLLAGLRYLDLSYAEAFSRPISELVPAFAARGEILSKLLLLTELGLGRLSLGLRVSKLATGAWEILSFFDLLSRRLSRQSLVLARAPFAHLNDDDIQAPMLRFSQIARQTGATFCIESEHRAFLQIADFII